LLRIQRRSVWIRANAKAYVGQSLALIGFALQRCYRPAIRETYKEARARRRKRWRWRRNW